LFLSRLPRESKTFFFTLSLSLFPFSFLSFVFFFMRPDQYSEHQQNFEKQLLMEQFQNLQHQKEQQQTHQGPQGNLQQQQQQQQQQQTQTQQLHLPFAMKQQQQQQQQEQSNSPMIATDNNNNNNTMIMGEQHLQYQQQQQQADQNFTFAASGRLPPSTSSNNLFNNPLHIDLEGLVARLNTNALPPSTLQPSSVPTTTVQSTFKTNNSFQN
jgi:hypothetical protein